jgi:hypothetical protein
VRTTKATGTKTESNDLINLDQRWSEVHRERRQALANRDRLRPGGSGGALPFSWRFLQAEEQIRALDEQLAVLDRQREAARTAAQARIIAARRPEHEAILSRLVAAAEAACDLATAERAYAQETADALGLAPGPAPFPQLLGLRDLLARFHTAPDLAPAPNTPALGMRRLRLLANYRDDLVYRLRGDIADFNETIAAHLLTRAIAEPVA